ncbi:MAG TPA: four helix bundle protein [Bacteroidales bacterium]|nr:four helix bundle protein [Bacteroidales bacterium]
MNKKEYEDRLLRLYRLIDQFCHTDPAILRREYLKDQLLRASSSALLNYGEAQVAASVRDYKHKLSIVLKALSEALLALKLLRDVGMEKVSAESVVSETEALLKILYGLLRKLRETANQHYNKALD